jgi:hypothetical protein
MPRKKNTYVQHVDVEDEEVEGEGEGHGQQQPDVALNRDKQIEIQPSNYTDTGTVYRHMNSTIRDILT